MHVIEVEEAGMQALASTRDHSRPIHRLDEFSGVVTLCETFEGLLGFDSTDRQFTLIQWAVKEPFQAWLGLHGFKNILKSSIDRLKKIIFHCTDQKDQVHSIKAQG